MEFLEFANFNLLLASDDSMVGIVFDTFCPNRSNVIPRGSNSRNSTVVMFTDNASTGL